MSSALVVDSVCTAETAKVGTLEEECFHNIIPTIVAKIVAISGKTRSNP